MTKTNSTAPDSLDAPDFTVIRAIGAIARTVQSESNARFRDVGLNNNGFIYIIRVCETPGMFLGELADAVHIDRTTAFRAVMKLVRDGFLRVESDARDKRMRRVFPSARGTEIYPQLHAYETQNSRRLLSRLTADERAELARLLNKLDY
jgi:DNA-binding MarR family transcriptional regulator